MNVFKQAGIYVLAGALALAGCSGEKGPAGANGTNGTNGAAGTSCSVAANPDGKSSTITCTDGTSVIVQNGTNGTNGTDGANGTSCTVVDNGNATRTITCAGTSVTVSDVVVDYAKMSFTEKAEANLNVVVTGFSVPADGKPVITFKTSDRNGSPIKGLGTAAPASVSYRIGLLKLATGVNGSANDTWVSYNAANATSAASAETANGVSNNGAATGGPLTDNGDGTYTYTLLRAVTGAAAGTTYDAAAVHRVVIIMSAGGNSFAPVNTVRDFVPNAFATDLTGQNDKVDPASCLECHTRFRANANGTGAGFHGGVRYDPRGCVACHNDQSRFVAIPGTGSTPLVNLDVAGVVDTTTGVWTGTAAIVNGESVFNLPVFIHKIHMGEELTLKGGNYRAVPMPYETHYPQDIRNCVKCHRAPAGTTTKADNWKAAPSRRACGACHDNVSFASAVPAGRVAHSGGSAVDDSGCAGCHSLASSLAVAAKHPAVAAPNPGNIFAVPTSTDPSAGRMNAAYVAAANVVPTGAIKLTYDVKAVGRDAAKHPFITFRFMNGVTPIVFQTYTVGSVTELMPEFVGSPSVQFAFAVPQDGKAAPADFNASASAFIRAVWNGSNANATMTFASGYYTITLNNVVVPDTATMLTGGIGYSYSLSNRDNELTRNMPLTQINLPAFPYNTAVDAAGNPTNDRNGGLIVPIPNVAKIATSDANTPASMAVARRQIVDTAKCNACHGFLGVNPVFHVGQRNDAPTCSFCHTPNQTSTGWSAGSKHFVHGVHAASKRTQEFGWHEVSATQGYWQVTYPGLLNNCESCHRAGTYDYSSTAAQTAISNSTFTTVGVGTYAAASVHSPYVAEAIPYGAGFATSGTSTTGTQGAVTCTVAAPCNCSLATPCDAAPTTLVISPVVTVCSACHTSPAAINHMQSDGFGSFYQPRQTASTQEYCLDCHGPGSLLSIKNVHSQP